MANNRILRCHSTVFFSLFICLFANFINSEDVPYTLLNSPSKLDAVIDFDTHHIHRRQAPVSSPPSPSAATSDPTTSPNGAPNTTPPTSSSKAPTTTPPTAAPQTTKNSGTTSSPNPTTTPLYTEVKDKNTHKYYKSKILRVTEHVAPYWEELYDTEAHGPLSGSHRVAVSVNVQFTFPFYGHQVNKITIATGGFLYMSPFLHQWLTATQYIAPLMANFDTSLGNESEIIYKEFNDRFVVEWRNLFLQDQNHTNPFYFQTILHTNGTIVFSYKDIPLTVFEIESKNHPVKIGLSDAFYIDSVVGGVNRRTIYEYHRVEINTTLVTENTVVILEPLRTCNTAIDCETCVTQEDEFDCKWCGKLQRCSDGFDWKRQEWRDKGCVTLSHTDEAKCNITEPSTTHFPSTSHSSTKPTKATKPIPCVGHNDSRLCMETTTSSVNATTATPSTEKSTITTPNTPNPTTQTPSPKPTTQTPSPKPTTQTPSPKPTTQTPSPKPTTQTPSPKPTTETPSPKPTTRTPSPKPTTQTPSPKPTTLKSTTQTTSTTTTPTKPTTTKPTTPKPTTQKSTTPKPTTQKPTTQTSTTPTLPPTSASTPLTTVPVGCVAGSGNCSILNKQTRRKGKSDNPTVAAVVVVIILLLALICGIGGWFYYAYTHPTSASGVWLIEHRPSQMKAKMAKMKFWKRSTPSGEKYAVETETEA